jgi:Putative Flp pilus-assembly TadE/G-like
MHTHLRHRSRGQTIGIAAVAMVALVGGLAMVIDGGMFFVIQRQLQSAADAGALAGAWHYPICPVQSPTEPPWPQSGCQASPPGPTPNGITVESPPTCDVPGTGSPKNCAWCPPVTSYAACDVAMANAQALQPLCGSSLQAFVSSGTQLNRPLNVNTIGVTVQCDAQYSFGRILGFSRRHISASAAAAMGDRDASNSPTCTATPPLSNGGDIGPLSSGTPLCGRLARLIK